MIEYTKLTSLPRLRVVQIGALKTREKTQRQHVVDTLTSPDIDDEYVEQRKLIAKYFPRDQIQAAELVHLPSDQLHILHDFPLHLNSLYAKQIGNLVRDLKAVPPKRTLGGSIFDGKTLVTLALKLVDTMNSNYWKDFGNQYKGIEMTLCTKAVNKYFKDLHEMPLDEVKRLKKERIQKFHEECVLEEERNASMAALLKMLGEREKMEDLIKQKQAADKEKDEAIKNQKKIFEEMKRKEKEKMEAERERDHTKRERDDIKRERDDIKRECDNFQRELKARDGWISRFFEQYLGQYAIPTVIGAAAMYLFSDVRLKQNLTILPYSKYHRVGLQSFAWDWNEKANELGLFGHEIGVIAQEVETLYPNMVTLEKSGYKQVAYHLLEILLRTVDESSVWASLGEGE